MKSGIYAVIAGLIVGNAFGALVPLPKPEPVYRLVPGEKTASVVDKDVKAPCPDLKADQEAKLEELWTALEEAEAMQREAQAQIRELIGDPPSFDDYPDDMQPENVEDTVLELLDTEVAELQWVDCSDAPCVAVLRLVGDDTDSPDAMRRAADPLRDAFGSDLAWEWFGVAEGNFMTVPLAPSPQADTVHHRTDLREELIINELLAAGMAE